MQCRNNSCARQYKNSIIWTYQSIRIEFIFTQIPWKSSVVLLLCEELFCGSFCISYEKMWLSMKNVPDRCGFSQEFSAAHAAHKPLGEIRLCINKNRISWCFGLILFTETYIYIYMLYRIIDHKHIKWLSTRLLENQFWSNSRIRIRQKKRTIPVKVIGSNYIFVQLLKLAEK